MLPPRSGDNFLCEVNIVWLSPIAIIIKFQSNCAFQARRAFKFYQPEWTLSMAVMRANCDVVHGEGSIVPFICESQMRVLIVMKLLM